MTYAPGLGEKDERKVERERERPKKEKRKKGQRRNSLRHTYNRATTVTDFSPRSTTEHKSTKCRRNFILEIRLDSFCSVPFSLHSRKKRQPFPLQP